MCPKSESWDRAYGLTLFLIPLPGTYSMNFDVETMGVCVFKLIHDKLEHTHTHHLQKIKTNMNFDSLQKIKTRWGCVDLYFEQVAIF